MFPITCFNLPFFLINSIGTYGFVFHYTLCMLYFVHVLAYPFIGMVYIIIYNILAYKPVHSFCIASSKVKSFILRYSYSGSNSTYLNLAIIRGLGKNLSPSRTDAAKISVR